MPVPAARLKRLKQSLRKEKVEGVLVTNFTNVTYLTGFTGDDSYLLVTLDGEVLLSDPRYTTQLEEECPGLKLQIREPGEPMLEAVAQQLKKHGLKRVAIEAGSMTVGLLEKLAEAAPIEFVACHGLVEKLRICKDKPEIEATRVAAVHARRAFEVVRAGITPEATEQDLAAELEYQARRFGASGLSFTPIVAVGDRAALPHARPTDRRIEADDFVLFDWGTNSGHYMSDITRMVVTGKLTAKFKKIYQIVLKAQMAAIDAIKPGMACEAVDAVARKIITKAGYGKEFGHGLGHGTGLEIHEAPRLARNQKTKLEAGMIVTVEPGIYLPGWGGIRIEDDILVTKNGYEVLTDVPKELEDCVLR